MTLTITDPMSVPTYRDTAFQRFLTSLLYDPRDVVFLRLTMKIFALMLPLLAWLFVSFNWWVLAAYLVIGAWYISPVILMLHNTMHRPFFKRNRLLNALHTYSLELLFGIPTGYMEHHVGMHHVENNVGEDLSATWRYERDNFFHWLHYFGRFLFMVSFELPAYLKRKKRFGMARSARVGDFLQTLMVVGIVWYDARLGLTAFLFPWFICRFAMMIGNWGQHAFIDPARPGDSMVNSITCINSGYNKRCFNDGYHIGHHVKANRHWSEMPQDFLDSTAAYAKAGSIVFKECDFFIVSILLFLGRYDVLARKFVPLDGRAWTEAEIIDLLKSRTRPIGETVSAAAVAA